MVKYHGVLKQVNHGIPQFTVQYHGLPCKTIKYNEIPWCTIYDGIVYFH